MPWTNCFRWSRNSGFWCTDLFEMRSEVNPRKIFGEIVIFPIWGPTVIPTLSEWNFHISSKFNFCASVAYTRPVACNFQTFRFQNLFIWRKSYEKLSLQILKFSTSRYKVKLVSQKNFIIFIVIGLAIVLVSAGALLPPGGLQNKRLSIWVMSIIAFIAYVLWQIFVTG